MKYFGTVKSYDNDMGKGFIKPEAGGEDLRFERSAFSWDGDKLPAEGQRLSYDVGTHEDRQPRATNLQAI